MASERFVVSHWWRLLMSGMLLVPCLTPLVYEFWRPTPEEFRHLPGEFGVPLGAWPFLIAVEGVFLGGAMWLFETKMMVVELTADGLTMYRIWKLRWEEVASARLRTSFGQRYLHVARARRRPRTLWVPLYFVGTRPLTVALRDHTPLGNPIRECLDAAHVEISPAP